MYCLINRRSSESIRDVRTGLNADDTVGVDVINGIRATARRNSLSQPKMSLSQVREIENRTATHKKKIVKYKNKLLTVRALSASTVFFLLTNSVPLATRIFFFSVTPLN